MDAVADLAERYSAGELRVVARPEPGAALGASAELCRAVAQAARTAGLASPNIGLLTDMIACPGGDFCALANARSIPIAADHQPSASRTWTTATTSGDDRPAHQRLHQLLRPPPQRATSASSGVDKDGQRVVPGHHGWQRRLQTLERARAGKVIGPLASPPTRCPMSDRRP
jgi:hypothetical protein